MDEAARAIDAAFSETTRDLKSDLTDIAKSITKETGHKAKILVYKSHYFNGDRDNSFIHGKEILRETELIGEISFDDPDDAHYDNFLYVLITARGIAYNHHIGVSSVYDQKIKSLSEIKDLYLKGFQQVRKNASKKNS